MTDVDNKVIVNGRQHELKQVLSARAQGMSCRVRARMVGLTFNMDSKIMISTSLIVEIDAFIEDYLLPFSFCPIHLISLSYFEAIHLH